jgi:hypothetical protein
MSVLTLSPFSPLVRTQFNYFRSFKMEFRTETTGYMQKMIP